MFSKQQGTVYLLTLLSCIWSSFASGQIRLKSKSSSTQCYGRVEVKHNGSWGTVCDHDWDLNDAEVVCRQLSCGPALQAPGSAHFGQGSDPIWLNNVACSGSESSLTLCFHGGFRTHDCDHSEDAGVICSGSLVKPSISMEPAGEVSWGQEVRITCSTAAELLGETFVLQKISDSFTQTQSPPGNAATFSIPQVNFGHDGSYQCSNEGTVSGQTFTSPTSDTLNVRVTVKPQRPNISLTSAGAGFVWGPGEAEVIRGHNFTLTCLIPGKVPQGQFFLIFSGNTTRENRSAVNNAASFTFPVAEFKHQGNYSCVYQVTSSSGMFSSSESAPITVSVKLPLLLLILMILGGVSILLLFILLLVFLVERRKKLRNSAVLYNTQRAPGESGDYVEDYENLQGKYLSANLTKESEDEDSNDYENAIFDENIGYQETDLQSLRKCASAQIESQEQEMDEEDEENSDDDNDYENVTVHFNQPVEDDYIDPTLDWRNGYPELGLKSQKGPMSAKSKSPEVQMDEDTSDDDNDYVNVNAFATAC